LTTEDQDATLTQLVADLANTAASQAWVDFFDVLLGSLMSLLRRIHSIHTVIMEAIETANKSNNSSSDAIIIPDKQLAAIKVIEDCIDILTVTIPEKRELHTTKNPMTLLST
jgi:phage gp46-like protein